MSAQANENGGVITFLFENSLFLIGGAAAALLYANLAPDSYHHLLHHKNGSVLGHEVNLFHFVVNDIAMAFFFLLAGKEIREAMLPGGPLSKVSTASLPILATLGGMAGPACIYALGSRMFQPELLRGWAVPMATDIAFSYLVARMIFPRIGGKTHPAIVFLLLLAIADDAGGLIVLAAFYPQGETAPLLLLGFAAAAIILSLVFWKVLKIKNFWPYLLVPGAISWFGFFKGGIHPALALVPLAWCLPHEHADLGFWEQGESDGQDTLNQMEHWWKRPVELILGLFGFANAGVVFSAVGMGTYLVFFALLFGKPIGIVTMTKIGQLFGLQLPEGMGNRHLVVVGFAAGIGFTVALFVSVVAFPSGTLQDSVKMGALASFLVAPVTLILGKILLPKKA
ncbi:MAG: Na+/H+ antiporter NhaA [Deltaproteobacteria bacterium]|nr:Na+/H+ antiporter NhaA [Deltaproteobacteria bacterium]